MAKTTIGWIVDRQERAHREHYKLGMLNRGLPSDYRMARES